MKPALYADPANVQERSAAEARLRRLSEELQRLIEAFAERPVRLREVLEIMHGRGYTMLLILLVFPFCTPLPLPGFSLPFGAVVAFIGLRLALGQQPWLPARLLNTTLPPRFFPRLLTATRRLVRWLERFLKPRLNPLCHWCLARHGVGLMILVCGLLMIASAADSLHQRTSRTHRVVAGGSEVGTRWLDDDSWERDLRADAGILRGHRLGRRASGHRSPRDIRGHSQAR